MTRQLVKVLLVDDDAMDVKAVTRAFAKQQLPNPITVAKDGQEALDILRGESGKPRLDPPMLILLDLQMPRMNGFEFLRALRADAKLKDTRVYVLTTSSHDVDRRQAWARDIAGYILKGDSNAFSKLGELLRADDHAH